MVYWRTPPIFYFNYSASPFFHFDLIFISKLENDILYFVCFVLCNSSSPLYLLHFNFYIFRRGRKIGLFTNVITGLIILAVMMVATVLGYHQISKLDINTSHNHLLDDFLLIICMPAFFLNSVFSIIPALYYGNVLKSIEIILEVSHHQILCPNTQWFIHSSMPC